MLEGDQNFHHLQSDVLILFVVANIRWLLNTICVLSLVCLLHYPQGEVSALLCGTLGMRR